MWWMVVWLASGVMSSIVIGRVGSEAVSHSVMLYLRCG